MKTKTKKLIEQFNNQKVDVLNDVKGGDDLFDSGASGPVGDSCTYRLTDGMHNGFPWRHWGVDSQC